MKKGFTLIETIIYIALFMILIGAGFSTAYGLIQSGDSLGNKTVTNSELDFVLRKIDWALSDLDSITTPATGSTNNLSVSKYSGGNVQIALDGEKVELNGVPITTDNVKVTYLNFERISGNPSGVIASVTIDGITGTTTKYLRK